MIGKWAGRFGGLVLIVIGIKIIIEHIFLGKKSIVKKKDKK